MKSANLIGAMRAAAILGLGCSSADLAPFQADKSVEWQIGMPGSSDGIDAVLLLGGDGTIHRHLGQLVQLGLPVLVVPAGSGNDFACSLGLRRVRDSVAAWRRFCAGAANVRTIDLGLISSGDDAAASYFCCVAGVGLDGEVARRANRLPRWLRGHGGYVLSLVPTILNFAHFALRLSTLQENGHWETKSDKPILLAVFANTPFYGGGMKVAPTAKMDDGWLDVCLVAGVAPLRLLYLFPSVYAGRHLKIREVEYFPAQNIRVETEHPMDVYADGELVCRTPVEIGIQPGALKVIAPA